MMAETPRVDSYVELLLHEARRQLEEVVKGNVLYFNGQLVALGTVDRIIKKHVEGITRRKNRRLIVLLETDGGEVGVVERINQIFRHHFREVWFIIPSHAYSAGTILVMSGDKIFMDYYSVLGPTDMQVRREGRSVPATGYLSSYDKLIADSKTEEGISPAELEILLSYDQAQMFDLRNGKKHADKVISEWLVQYKFKDWDKDMNTKKERANEIASKLSDAEFWSSHGRGIPIDVVRKELRIKVEDFGNRHKLSASIKNYCDLLRDYGDKIGAILAIHSEHDFSAITNRREEYASKGV